MSFLPEMASHFSCQVVQNGQNQSFVNFNGRKTKAWIYPE